MSSVDVVMSYQLPSRPVALASSPRLGQGNGIKAGEMIIPVPTALPGVNSRLNDAKNEQAKIVEVGPFSPWVYTHMKQITAVGLVGLMS